MSSFHWYLVWFKINEIVLMLNFVLSLIFS
nr:MAG TPA: hypothetical protein [Caudoviricetes sp.]DAN34919.1 MAG TPA: hypothetical protein [Caudoviricetes sp.]